MISFLKPNILEEDITTCIDSIKSGWLAYGKYTELVEKELSTFFQSDDFVMTSSCTASLQMALELSGVQRGDEVITTPLTWVATANVALYVGATPVFADVNEFTGLIDIDKIIQKINDKTKAIIVVDLYGQMFNINELKRRLNGRKISIIEDAAHSIGSKINGQPPGHISDFACFSFHAAKNMTSGQGGGLICGIKEHYAAARLIRRDGVVGANQFRKMLKLGHKFDSTDFQSALLLNQISRYPNTDKKRKAVYANYINMFSGSEDYRFQKSSELSEHSGHMFVLWLTDTAKREGLVEYLSKHEIQSSVHYNPVHLEPYYRETFGYVQGDFPAAEKIGAGAISLPTYPQLEFDEQLEIKRRVEEFFEKN